MSPWELIVLIEPLLRPLHLGTLTITPELVAKAVFIFLTIGVLRRIHAELFEGTI